ncbi:MAG TPA: hypothetical protein VFK38_00420 [Candidatus Limnocylindrales bacterium]|nr:hypothetical protein [Candidatus Limnocylindrales bacterium]
MSHHEALPADVPARAPELAEQGAAGGHTAAVLGDDLIWASRLAAAAESAGAQVLRIRSAAGLVRPDRQPPVDLLLVDLALRSSDPYAAITDASAVGVSVLAVGQHEDAASLRRAREAGAGRVTSYDHFHRQGPRLVAALLAARPTQRPGD